MKPFKTLLLLTLSLFLYKAGTAQTCAASFSTSSWVFTQGDTILFNNTSKYDTSSFARFFWSFGDGSTQFTSGGNVHHIYKNAGSYAVCLTLFDSLNNCSSTHCDSILVKPDSTFSSCDARFTYSAQGRNVIFKNKSTYSGSAANYTWYFGDGKMGTSNGNISHTYAANGAYKVSLVLKTSSCTDSISQIVYALDSTNDSSTACRASFYYTTSAVNKCIVQFYNLSKADSGASAYWSFGNGLTSSNWNDSSSFSKEGWYAVSLTISDSNCTSSVTDSIYVYACDTTNSNRGHYIGGQVITGNTLAQNAIIYLIAKDSSLLYAIDTTSIDSGGFYYFSNVKAGNYYIKAALTSSDPNFSDYLPTYFSNVLRWDSAFTAAVFSDNWKLDINMIKGYNAGGSGFIGGDVTKGANKKAGEALNDIQVTILDDSYSPVAYAYSNKSGKFELPNLAFGKYFLFVDIPGLKTEGTWIELTAEKPRVEDVKIEVNSNSVSTNLGKALDFNEVSFKVYPNPAQDYLVVSFNQEVAQIEIIDINGKLLYSSKVSNNGTINLSQLSKGTYYMQLKSVNNNLAPIQRQVLIKN